MINYLIIGLIFFSLLAIALAITSRHTNKELCQGDLAPKYLNRSIFFNRETGEVHTVYYQPQMNNDDDQKNKTEAELPGMAQLEA